MKVTFTEPENTLFISMFSTALKDNTSFKISQKMYPKYQFSVSLSMQCLSCNSIITDCTDTILYQNTSNPMEVSPAEESYSSLLTDNNLRKNQTKLIKKYWMRY